MDKDLSTQPISTSTPPDQASSGDVSTTGHSSHDADTHGAAADSHGGHGGHGPDTSDVPTIVPTTFAQLILPAIILIVVGILVAGPILNAFANKPAAPTMTEQHGTSGTGAGAAEGEATPLHSEVKMTATTQPAPTQTKEAPQATPTTAANIAPLSGTQTAVAAAGEQGEVARVPVSLEFHGTAFEVKPGTGLLPDWKAPATDTTATWIVDTVANHILYIPFSPTNLNLFTEARAGDVVKMTMNTGQVFSFAVTRSERAVNGPPTAPGQFTVRTAMAQDHAGVTLFLAGDPATDRAVVQADFTGNIQ